MSKKVTTAPAPAEPSEATGPVAEGSDTATQPAAPEDADQAAEAQAQAEHPEAVLVRELLTRNRLPKAWILPGGHLCFDERHAKAVAGADFEALPTITAD